KAADLLQDLFLRARAHSDIFCEMENPRTWLYRVARNLLIDEYRTTREFVELEEDALLTDASPDAISTLDICLPETLQALPEDERW
ncbi:RNA polymerase subunit sigma-70, partial [Escherichia coli]|nr:RNA polymerase subunit sigma-70 [Escherichia coli]